MGNSGIKHLISPDSGAEDKAYGVDWEDLVDLLDALLNSSKKIPYSSLSITGALTNTDINASAAIAESKLNLSFPTHAQAHKNEHKVAGSDAFADGDNLDANARVEAMQGGVSKGKRRTFDFIAGDNTTWTITDVPGSEKVTVKVDSPGGGGGGDMYKSTYDINTNDVVDNSEKLEGSTKSEVQAHSHTVLTDKGTHTHPEIDTHVDSTSNPHSVTKTQVALDNVTNDAQLKRADGDINSFPIKALPSDADVVLVEDSDASYTKKKVTVASLPSGGAGALKSSYDWTMWRADSTYYAIDWNGTNLHSGSNCASIINHLEADHSSQDSFSIFIKAGDFALSEEILFVGTWMGSATQPRKTFTLHGAGYYSTVFHPSAGVHCIHTKNSAKVDLAHFGVHFPSGTNVGHGIYASEDGATSLHGIVASAIYDIKFDYTTPNQGSSHYLIYIVNQIYSRISQIFGAATGAGGIYSGSPQTNEPYGDSHLFNDNIWISIVATNGIGIHLKGAGSTWATRHEMTISDAHMRISGAYSGGVALKLDNCTKCYFRYINSEGPVPTVIMCINNTAFCQVSDCPNIEAGAGTTVISVDSSSYGNRFWRIHCWADSGQPTLINDANNNSSYPPNYFSYIQASGGTTPWIITKTDRTQIWECSGAGFGSGYQFNTYLEYQSQSGAWANPSGAAWNGRKVVVYNTSSLATRLYTYSNGAWTYLAYSEQYTFKGFATLNQSSPVQNTWYTVLSQSDNVELGVIKLRVNGASETLELEILVDGVTLLGRTSAIAGTEYYVALTGNDGSVFTGLGSGLQLWIVSESEFSNVSRLTSALTEHLKGKSVRVRARKTSAGSATSLQSALWYNQIT